MASGVPTTAAARAADQGRSQTMLWRAARLRTTRTRSLERGARSATAVGAARVLTGEQLLPGNSKKRRRTARATVAEKPAANDRVGMRRALEAPRFRLDVLGSEEEPASQSASRRRARPSRPACETPGPELSSPASGALLSVPVRGARMTRERG